MTVYDDECRAARAEEALAFMKLTMKLERLNNHCRELDDLVVQVKLTVRDLKIVQQFYRRHQG